MREKEGYSPEQLVTIQTTLILTPVKEIEHALVQIERENGALHLDQIERILRGFDSPLFLVAIPMEMVEEITDLKRDDVASLLLQTGIEKEYPYFLYAILDNEGNVERGQIEVSSYIQSLGLDPEENLKNLANTGMLRPRPGTSFSREHMAPHN